ncbi:uncharacterized protein B0H18DRAFT_647706 [Fomitopsis serialis]|uniref:uncharacterized protein n=1 Tax=Fomitopsis serialis TaxID=139415 RepID=UPI002008AA65|nr:uncharacterized protein B0H18DRAFT_647706 [Neoantrodia serialis]KAH9933501.1 hypothetical protein B0H18DRAFT_647706 [Neoantrodia serialis]
MQTQLDLDPTLGSLFIAGFFSTILYGASCAQFMFYTRHYFHHDKSLVKGLVFLIWILDTVTTVSELYIFWCFAIRGHANWFDLLTFSKLYELDYATISVTTCVVQIFYIHGIWQLSETSSRKYKLAISALPMVLSIICLALGFAAIYDTAASDWIITRSLGAVRVPLTIRVCAAAVVDVYISIAISWVLRMRKTGFRRCSASSPHSLRL